MVSRRKFLYLSVGALALTAFNSCSSFLSTSDEKKIPPPDVTLTPDEKTLSENLRSQFDRLWNIVNNPGRKFYIEIKQENVDEVLSFSFVKNSSASYPHLRIVREKTGDAVNLVWGSKNLTPSVKFTDDIGKTLNIGGTELEISLADINASWSDLSREDLLVLGMKIVAVGLAVWLGIKISQLILSAIAFLAFNAMVLGLLIVSLTIIVTILSWVIERTGWTIDDVKEFFRKTANEIINLLRDIVNFLTGNQKIFKR